MALPSEQMLSGLEKTDKRRKPDVLSNLYIRHPSQAAAVGASPQLSLVCAFAMASDGGAIEREGASTLSAMSDMISQAKRVVLLLAASDVSLLRVKVPPMSAAKLRLALPNLVEDQIISDPSECVVVAASASVAGSDGLRSVAVVERVWLELLRKTLLTLGAKELIILPAQLCAPYQEGVVSAVVAEHDVDIELTLRLSLQEGIGLPVVPEKMAFPARDVQQILRAIVPAGRVNLYVPEARVNAYQEAADDQVTVMSDNWLRWIVGAREVPLDLNAGLDVSNGSRIDWQRWRWPLALALVVGALNITGLNIDWWRMKKEASSLKTAMLQTYKLAYPNGSLAHTPIEMMRQQIGLAKHETGLSAPDDFLALAVGFGETAGGVVQKGRTTPGITAIEYRDHELIVRFKSDAVISAPEIKAALAPRNLSVSDLSDHVLRIRSGK